MKLESPHINTNKTEKEQIKDIYNYLFRLSRDINFNLESIEKRIQDREEINRGGKLK